MKFKIIAAVVSLVFVAEGAFAACTGTQVTGATLTALLNNNTVCAARGGESWQEEHHSNGELWDYKMGTGHPVDPRKKLGGWSVDETANTVTYTYDGGPQYTYAVWNNGGAPTTYSFCVGSVASVENATVLSGVGSGCP